MAAPTMFPEHVRFPVEFAIVQPVKPEPLAILTSGVPSAWRFRAVAPALMVALVPSVMVVREVAVRVLNPVRVNVSEPVPSVDASMVRFPFPSSMNLASIVPSV